MSIGKTIKDLRLNKGWSQEELAHRVGTTTPSISRIETGKHGASDQLKQLIAQEFGLKVSELVALSEVDKSSAKKTCNEQKRGRGTNSTALFSEDANGKA